MLTLILLTAATNAAAQPASTAASAPAQAVVRIMRGVEIRFDERPQFEASVPRETTIREPDGSVRSASLIEFY